MLAKENIVFKTVDSVGIHADVYLPESHSLVNQYSAILYLHGGGMVVGDRGMLPETESRGFLEKGWIVVSADYRLIPETKYPEACQDAFDAYTWMRTEGKSQYGIDENRIAIVGSSAGARIALLAGHKVKNLPCCIVSLYGQTDFRLNDQSWLSLRSIKVPEEYAFSAVYKHGIRTSTPPNSALFQPCMAYLAWAVQKNELLKAYFGEDYDQANLLKDYSPVQNAHSQYPPTLLVHGKSDNLTPIIHSQNMYEALKNENVNVDSWSPEG